MKFFCQDSAAVLCRKEQELKSDGRLFVKQIYAQRLAQTCLECNLENHVLEYMPEQITTNSELDQNRRLLDIAIAQGGNIEMLE